MKALDNLPKYEEFTQEMMQAYFPDSMPDQYRDPEHFPYMKKFNMKNPENQTYNYCGQGAWPFAPKPKKAVE